MTEIMSPQPVILSDPFIGQIEYLEHLTIPEIGRKVPFTEIKFYEGDIDLGILQPAIAHLVKRHETLRTIFPKIDGQIRQAIVAYDKERFKLEMVDTVDAGCDPTLFKRSCYEEAVKSFAHLGKGPLVRFFLFKMGEGKYYFSMIIHHLLCDAWSARILKDEMAALYFAFADGKQPALDPLPLQLRDYCAEKNEFITRNLGRISAFWKDQLHDYREMVDVAAFYRNYGKRHGDPSFVGKAPVFNNKRSLLDALNRQGQAASYLIYIDLKVFTGIKQLARRSRCTVSTVLYASFYLFIFLYTGKRKVLLASLVADRFKAEYGSLIGCLLGGIYLPMDVCMETNIGQLLEDTFANFETNAAQIINNHDILDLDGQEIRANCDLYINYIVQGQPLNRDNFFHRSGHKCIDDAYYAVNCKVEEYTDDLSFSWEYNKIIFSRPLMEDMARFHLNILKALVTNPAVSVQDVADNLVSI